MGLNQSSLLAPALLAFGAACTERSQLELASVSFGGESYQLYDLRSTDFGSGSSTGIPFLNITDVNNEPDLNPYLISLKTELLKLAETTGYLLSIHKATGGISAYIAEPSLQAISARAAALNLNQYLLHTKYPSQIDLEASNYCVTSDMIAVNDGEYIRKAEEVAYKVADLSACVISSIILLENVEDFLTKQAESTISAQNQSEAEINNALKAWEGVNEICVKLDRAQARLFELYNLTKE